MVTGGSGAAVRAGGSVMTGGSGVAVRAGGAVMTGGSGADVRAAPTGAVVAGAHAQPERPGQHDPANEARRQGTAAWAKNYLVGRLGNPVNKRY